MSLKRVNRSGIGISTTPKMARSLSDASGLPGPATSIVATATANTTASLTWSAPSIVGDSAITTYTVSGGGTAVVSGTTATITGLTANTSYTFSVAAVNAVGTGVSQSASPITTLNFNEATGGSTTDVSNYNGTGQTWRVHTFTSNGTFTVTNSNSTFSALVIAGGGDGTLNYVGGTPSGLSVGGGAGGMLTDTSLSLTNTAYSVVVGANGRPGGTSSFHTISTTGGGGGRCANSPGCNSGINGGSGGGGTGDSGGLAGGTGIAGQGYAGAAGTSGNGGSGGGAGGVGVYNGNGGPGRASTITGSSVTYGIGGTRGSGTVGRANMGDGGGGNAAGSSGRVIVAYRIG